MDKVDEADKTIEMHFLDALTRAKKHQSAAVATGFCLYCAKPLDDGRRWCDADCRDAWELENERIKHDEY
jgi:hypothetical protein